MKSEVKFCDDRSALDAVVDSSGDGVGFVGTEDDFEHSAKHRDWVFGIWAGISILKQEVSKWYLEQHNSNSEEHNKPQIPHLPGRVIPHSRRIPRLTSIHKQPQHIKYLTDAQQSQRQPDIHLIKVIEQIYR